MRQFNFRPVLRFQLRLLLRRVVLDEFSAYPRTVRMTVNNAQMSEAGARLRLKNREVIVLK